MANTRAMKVSEFDKDLHSESVRLAGAIASLRAEIARDPEGAMGGRGNNIASVELEAMQARQAELMKMSYDQADDFADLIEAGVDPDPVTSIRYSDRRGEGIRIRCRRGHGRDTGGEYESDWIYNLESNEWMGEEPPAMIVDVASKITQTLAGVDLVDFRGSYSTPRVYI